MTNIIIILLFSSSALLANEQLPGSDQKRPILLRGGTLHTVSGDVLEGYDMVDEDEIVNETFRRVKNRLSRMQKEERLLESLTQKKILFTRCKNIGADTHSTYQ